MQQPRGLEQHALLALAAELVAQLVEQQERERPDLLDVTPVALAALGELPEQPERIRRADLLGSRHLQQQSLAQAEGAHRQRPRPHPIEQLRRDRQAGQDDVGALGVEPGHSAAVAQPVRRKQRCHLAQRARAQLVRV